MQFTAKITAVTIGTDSNETGVSFSLHDGNETGMVSFYDTINQAHACYLIEHTSIGRDDDAYSQMVQAVASATDEELLALIGREFTSDDERNA